MSHMWNPYVPPMAIPTHPPIRTVCINPGERAYFSQYGGKSQVECEDHASGYEQSTATFGADHTWTSPMSSPGLLSPKSGEWPLWRLPRRPILIDSSAAPHNIEGRHADSFVPHISPNLHYGNGGRGPGNYLYGGTNACGQRASYGPRPKPDVERKVVGRGRNIQGNVDDLDKQRNRTSSFRHPPIDFGRRQIRLVRVLPTEPGAPIKCKFALSMVDNKSVRYTALSYTWGSASSETDIERIILHKQNFWTRRNLWFFLRQVRDDPALSVNWYWIDALCIDQAETGRDGQQEKNHQVNMMSQIYSNAHSVMTWLGEPDPEEHAALDALQSCIDNRSCKRNHALIRRGLRYLGDAFYWSRIWIIQEMVLAKRARFRVGDYNFDWSSIYSMRLEARGSNTWRLQDMGWAMTNVLDLRQDWYRGRPLDLVNGMQDFGTRKCSDPRDKIYGLLGLMSHKPCIPDYSKSCKELYVEVVLWALRQDLIQAPARRISMGHTFNRCNPCAHLKLWSTALRLEASECQHAQEQLADELGNDWPLMHPWACHNSDWV
ncbi:heterokaryon incompatibility protein-domain-containing protein [Phaeosphaeria sp. MPI-PUGE-AT-0046c]|nr:heterokaryon incompatibility protein-domain-containing protein [Phaeosphaeria sp. MPI-PUGE-AT-0046c]